MDYLTRLNQTINYLKSRVLTFPKTLVILGSGLGDFSNDFEVLISIPYHEIPHFQQTAVVGHLGELLLLKINQQEILVMKGRNHYYQGISDEDIRLPLQAFAFLGVQNLIVTNACGGMNPRYKAGDIMIIEDHINMMGRNPLVGENISELGPRFFDMSEPYSLEYIQSVEKIANDNHIQLQKGVYVGYLGPNYETKAEIRAFRMLGGDAVGMSTIPEVLVARQAGMKVLGLSVITNMSTGIQKSVLSHDEVLVFSKLALSKMKTVLTNFIETLNNS